MRSPRAPLGCSWRCQRVLLCQPLSLDRNTGHVALRRLGGEAVARARPGPQPALRLPPQPCIQPLTFTAAGEQRPNSLPVKIQATALRF